MDRSKSLRERAIRLEQATFAEFWTSVLECSSILEKIAPGKRKPWLEHVLREMHHAQDGLCGLCGKPMEPHGYEVDHKIPFTYGGGNERTNLQLAHPECNRRKGSAVDPYDLLKYLEDRYMNL